MNDNRFENYPKSKKREIRQSDFSFLILSKTAAITRDVL